jgi:hypothetical protein
VTATVLAWAGSGRRTWVVYSAARRVAAIAIEKNEAIVRVRVLISATFSGATAPERATR